MFAPLGVLPPPTRRPPDRNLEHSKQRSLNILASRMSRVQVTSGFLCSRPSRLLVLVDPRALIDRSSMVIDHRCYVINPAKAYGAHNTFTKGQGPTTISPHMLAQTFQIWQKFISTFKATEVTEFNRTPCSPIVLTIYVRRG
jgi:hypothetical protein